MQMSAASPSPSFHLGKSYVQKITVYFLAICVNIPFKIEKFELEVADVCRLDEEFAFKAAINISYWLTAAKRAIRISFFIFYCNQ